MLTSLRLLLIKSVHNLQRQVTFADGAVAALRETFIRSKVSAKCLPSDVLRSADTCRTSYTLLCIQCITRNSTVRDVCRDAESARVFDFGIVRARLLSTAKTITLSAGHRYHFVRGRKGKLELFRKAESFWAQKYDLQIVSFPANDSPIVALRFGITFAYKSEPELSVSSFCIK